MKGKKKGTAAQPAWQAKVSWNGMNGSCPAAGHASPLSDLDNRKRMPFVGLSSNNVTAGA